MMDKTRIKIADNISITKIIDTKFVTNTIAIRFITDHTEKYASSKALCGSIITTASKSYPTITSMSQKLASLYNSSLWNNIYKLADKNVLMVGTDFIMDKLAYDGEKVSCEMAQILIDCIFNPAFTETECDKDLFESLKKDLVDCIEAKINEKRSYALNKASETAFVDEPLAIPTFGTLEQAKALTLADVYDAYQYILHNSNIEVTIAGGGDFDEAYELVKNALMPLASDSKCNDNYVYHSKQKSEVANVNEKLDVNQCKLVMVYKSDYDNLLANKLMSVILGGSAFSKLFLNVREKLSLCYYCAARYVEDRCAMIIDSGVEKVNVEKAIDEIINQLENIKNGDITDDEINNTKLYIASSAKCSCDYVSDMISWDFTQFVRKTNYTPQEYIDKLYEVTKEQIIEAAKSVKLDTVYLLESEESV